MDLEKQVKLGCVNASLIENINRRLYGEILTICDASVANLQSLKAIKGLVSQAFTRHSRGFMEDLNRVGGI